MTSKPHRIYSDDERAAALAALKANGGNVSRTARQVGVPIRTLRQWRKGTRCKRAAQQSIAKRKPLADLLEDLAYKLVGAMPGKIKKATLQQAAVSAGISIEKCRLLRDQSTVNADIAVSVEDVTRARKQVEDWERARLPVERNGQLGNGQVESVDQS